MSVTPHVAAKLSTAVHNEPSENDKPKVKFHIHLCAIAIAGVTVLILVHFHIGNEFVTSFAPFLPNVAQETLDMLKRL